MFYIFNENDILQIKEQLARINPKLESLNPLNESESSKKRALENKIKHLKECKQSLEACLEGKDEDEFDFFIHRIYTLTWGLLSKEEREKFDPKEHPEYFDEAFDRVKQDLENLPSLKELAKTTFKDRLESEIYQSQKMQERLEIYDEKGVPRKISVRQAKLALLNAGLLDDIEAMIEKSEKSVQISWEYATEFERNNPLILSFGALMKMSEEELDELFKLAKTL